ncbi:hypothetical protein FRC03_009711 [Tulasnella sp. 419]|nr:hypothetical protein FRC03_009711 [Tulasnella sp. 419]
MATPESRAARFAPDTNVHKIWEDLLEKRKVEQQDAIRRGLIPAPDAKYSLENAITIVGTCEDKCPYFECVRRHEQNELKRFEMNSNNKSEPDYNRMVKSWTRPTDLGENRLALPSDFRTPDALKRTTDYLFHDLLDECPSFVNVHEFIFDRTRSIRQDFSTQQYPGLEIAIECHERIARFHIISLHEMRWPLKPSNLSLQEDELVMEPESRKEYSAHLEMKELHKTLTSLGQLYDDLRARGKAAPNEAEFRAYQAIAQTNFEAGRQLQRLPFSVLSHPIFQVALEIRALLAIPSVLPKQSKALPSILSRLFKLLQGSHTTFLMACLVETQLPRLRRGWLAAFAKSTGLRTTPTSEIMRILWIDNKDQFDELAKDLELELQSISGIENIVISKASTEQIVRAPVRDSLHRVPFIDGLKGDRKLGEYIDGTTGHKTSVSLVPRADVSSGPPADQQRGRHLFGTQLEKPIITSLPKTTPFLSSQSQNLNYPLQVAQRGSWLESSVHGPLTISQFGASGFSEAFNRRKPTTSTLPSSIPLPTTSSAFSVPTRPRPAIDRPSERLPIKPTLPLPENRSHQDIPVLHEKRIGPTLGTLVSIKPTVTQVSELPMEETRMTNSIVILVVNTLFSRLVHGVVWGEVAGSLADEAYRRKSLKLYWAIWKWRAQSRYRERTDKERLEHEREQRRERLRRCLDRDVDFTTRPSEATVPIRERRMLDSHRRHPISVDSHMLLVDQSKSSAQAWLRGSFLDCVRNRIAETVQQTVRSSQLSAWLVVNNEKQSTRDWLWTKFNVSPEQQGQAIADLDISISASDQSHISNPGLLIFELSPSTLLPPEEARQLKLEQEIQRLNSILDSLPPDLPKLTLLILYWNDGVDSNADTYNELAWHFHGWRLKRRVSRAPIHYLSLVGFTSHQDYDVTFQHAIESLDFDTQGSVVDGTPWTEVLEAYYDTWKAALLSALEVIDDLAMDPRKSEAKWTTIGLLVSNFIRSLDRLRQDLQLIAGIPGTVMCTELDASQVYDERSLRQRLLLYVRQSVIQDSEAWLNWSENVTLLTAPEGLSEDEFPYEKLIRNLGDQVTCRLSSLAETVWGNDWLEKLGMFRGALTEDVNRIKEFGQSRSTWSTRESRKRGPATDLMLAPTWKKMKALDISDDICEPPPRPPEKTESLQELDDMLIEAEKLLATVS